MPVEPPEMHAPHGAHTGQRWVDMLLALTAVLVSAISLYVATDNGRSMERLVAANSWPNLQFDTSVTRGDTEGSAKLSLGVKNNGVGPARLETLEIWHDDTPLKNADELGRWLKELGGGRSLIAQLEGSTVIGNVLGADGETEMVALSTIEGEAWGQVFIKAASSIESRMCYCSVFDDCYVTDTRDARRRAKTVGSCPVPAVAYDDDLAAVMAKQSPTPPDRKAAPK